MGGPLSLQQPKSWSENALREFKVSCLRTRRRVLWRLHPAEYPRPALGQAANYPVSLLTRRLPLRRLDADAHPLLEDGKVTNLKLAAPCFDGLELGPGKPLSFWRALGRITAQRGFQHGMELRAGCVVPALGGGLCLLSNALFDLAARLDWVIHERHGHTVEATPTWSRPWGMDATVFWPYVDLRIEPRVPCLLRVRVENETLVLEVLARHPWNGRVELESRCNAIDGAVRSNQVWRRRFSADGALLGEEMVAENRKQILHAGPQRRRNCLTCGETGCRARVNLNP